MKNTMVCQLRDRWLFVYTLKAENVHAEKASSRRRRRVSPRVATSHMTQGYQVGGASAIDWQHAP